jgi:hypothetical protein
MIVQVKIESIFKQSLTTYPRLLAGLPKKITMNAIGFGSLIILWNFGRVRPQFRFLFGDDYLTVRRFQSANNLDSLADAFFAPGSGKWRPLNMLLLKFTSDKWGFNAQSYFTFNSILLLLLGLIVAYFCSKLLRNEFLGICLGALVILSRFSWYSQFTLYGQMEIPALIFFMLGVFAGAFTIRWKDNSPILLFLVFGCFMIASLFHERYVIPGVAILLVLIFLGARNHVKTICSLAFLMIATHLVAKSYLIGVDPFTGGGESSLRALEVSTFSRNLLTSAKMGLGYYSGLTSFNSAESGKQVVIASGLKAVSLLVWLPYIASFLVLRSNIKKSLQFEERARIMLLFLVAGLALLIPAATISSRVEGRWLFGSFICLGFVIVTFINEISKSVESMLPRVLITSSLLLVFLAPDFYYRRGLAEFSSVQSQTERVFQLAESKSPRTGPWLLSIILTDPTRPLDWQLGYGFGFSQLENPPLSVSIARSELPCDPLKREILCVKIFVGELEQPLLFNSELIGPVKQKRL